MLKDGWYFCKLKQVKKQRASDPDFIFDWVKFKNGEWNLYNYASCCEFDSIIRSE